MSADPLVHEDGELKMKFKMVTRKGQKQQVCGHVIAISVMWHVTHPQLKEVNIPLDSGLASSLKDTQRVRLCHVINHVMSHDSNRP